ncbi:MAG: hypothetical protein WD688_06750 [Candidatus Binatia bacterium]
MKIIMKRLGIADTAAAEVGLQDYVRRADRKPYPQVEGLRNVQRLMKLSNPAIAKVKVEELIDDSLLRDIENSGFLDRAYRGISEVR